MVFLLNNNCLALEVSSNIKTSVILLVPMNLLSPSIKGQPIINCTKEKKANSIRVKTYYSESFLRGHSHFFQLKEHLHKNVKGKKGLCKIICWSSPLKIRQEKAWWLMVKMSKKDANLS
jgi:hypothetical protein